MRSSKFIGFCVAAVWADIAVVANPRWFASGSGTRVGENHGFHWFPVDAIHRP